MSLIRKRAWWVLAFMVLTSIGGIAYAAVTAEEAAQLGKTLTPMGSERAGNKEGTIPEWTGGLKGLPPGGSAKDLYPNEKPLFTITAQNMGQYADKIAPGLQAWFKKRPEFRMNVYPTHRTQALPEWIYKNIAKNAVTAKLEDGGDTVVDAIGGIPFPIPKSGIEVQWNHQLRYQGEAFDGLINTAYVFTPSGKRILTGSSAPTLDYPYYYKGMTYEKLKKEYRSRFFTTNTTMVAPPDQVGSMTGGEGILDFGKRNPLVYQYLVGQRRVRLAPNVAFDAPNPANNGANNVDESYLFAQSPEKYDWKLLGKKEMYIMYNNNKLNNTHADKEYDAHFYKPELVRWELHRVWVVDATLKKGMRHTKPRRVFYVDEDSWTIAVEDTYDAQGKLWTCLASTFYYESMISTVHMGENCVLNLQTGGWMSTEHTEPGESKKRVVKPRPVSVYSPEGMASRGVR